jgi:adenylate kinase
VILLLFGPPGCGKGTQSTSLAARFGIPAISTGEVFRAEIKAGTPLGKMASAIMASGALVSDDIVNGIVANRIATAPAGSCWTAIRAPCRRPKCSPRCCGNAGCPSRW